LGRFDVTSGQHPLLPLVAAAMNTRSRLTGIATGDQAIFVTRVRRRSRRVSRHRPDGRHHVRAQAEARVAPALSACAATTSGRRWEQRGVLRTIFLMWCLRLAYFFGADPQELARRYGTRVVPPARA